MAEKSATVQTAAQTQKFGEFKRFGRETRTATLTTLYILEKQVDHPTSMELLDKAGLRPLTYKEALCTLMDNEELKNQLKGKWFYLAGTGKDINRENGLYTIDRDGSLVNGSGPSPETTLRYFNGPHPLSLFVLSDDFTSIYYRRYDLAAINEPQFVASVVVGVPKDETKNMLRK